MSPISSRLAAALTLSLLLHALPLAWDFLPAPRPMPHPPPLAATLRPPPAAAQPRLLMPEQPRPRAEPPAPPAKPAARHDNRAQASRSWQEEVRRQFRKRDAAGLFYPREAIAAGLEGEALVLLVLGEDGSATAARIERSSGHAILDDAALRAALALRSLPADAPRETLLPVRFRLH